MMRVLVTGAQGYLGGHFVNILKKQVNVVATGRNKEQNIYMCDLTKSKEVNALMKYALPDFIIHCAAYVPENMEEYMDSKAVKNSLLMLDNVLRFSKSPIIYISSMTVYGDCFVNPVSEDGVVDSCSEYGVGKLRGEEYIRSDGRPGFAVRIPGLFGLPRKEGLVYNLLNSVKYRKKVSLPDKKIVWASMHVYDAASSVVKLLMSRPTRFESVNIGYKEEYSISKLVKIVCEMYDYQYSYKVDQPCFAFNLDRAKEYNVLPTNTLESSLLEFSYVV